MATTPKNLALETITDATTLHEFYGPVSSGINTSYTVLGLTNNTTSAIVLSLYKSDGSNDFLIDKITLPGGVGLRRNYYDIQREVSNAGGSLKIQSDVAQSFTVNLNGREIEI